MAEPATWVDYEDPFGDWHDEPCDGATPVVVDSTPAHENESAS
jgi:hypothetical protein